MKTHVSRSFSHPSNRVYKFKCCYIWIVWLLLLGLPGVTSAQNKLWDKTFGGNGHDWLITMQHTTDGGYILGGDSYSNKSGDKSQINRGKCYDGYCSADYWIVKLRADGSKEWDKTFGGYRDDKLTSIWQTQDGGYIIAGSSISGKGGDKSQGMQGGSDIWILKLTAEGTKVWDKTFHKAGFDMAASIQQTRDGGYILGGTSNVANWDAGDYWIIKLKEDGTKVWDKTIQADRADYLITVQQTNDNGYILGGNSISGVGGDKTEPHKGGKDPEENYLYSDYWIVKLRADGSKEWDKTLGGTDEDALTSLQQTGDGGYIVGGTSWSEISGDKSEPTRNGYLDYWVVKLKADGTKEWDKTIGGSNHDELASLQQTPDGGYILGGHSYSGISGDKTQVNKGGQDYWLVKLNANGTKVWDKTFGGIGDDVLTSLQQTRDGNFILGGYSYSGIGGDKSEANKGSCDEFNCSGDYWIIKLREELPLTASWNMRYGGSGKDNFTSAIKTQGGGYLSGGYSNSDNSGDKTQISQGKNDFWVVKSDQNGKKEWDKRYGGSANDYLNRVIQTQDGGYLLAGTSHSSKSGDKSQDSLGDKDFWIVKVDKQGKKEWDKTYGGSGEDELKKVIQLSSGDYVLGGYSNSPVRGHKSQGNQGSTDYWLVKIGNSGEKIWDKRYGGNLNEKLGSFIETADGGFFLGGSSWSGKSGDKQEVSRGASDYWAVKTDKDGNLVWEKTYGGSGADEVYSVRQITGNNFYLAGTSGSGKEGDKSQKNHGGKDYWLVKLDKKGGKLWDKTFGGSKDDELRASTFTEEGHYILAGNSYSKVSGDKSQPSQGESDYWVVEVDENGNKVQDQRYGGNGAEELRTVTQTKDGDLLLGGRSESGVSGDRNQPSQGGTDFWLVKVAPETKSIVAAREGVETKESLTTSQSLNLTAYPNPATNRVTINFTLPATQSVSLKVLDSQGRKINTLFQGEAKANQKYELHWNANNQVNGVYLMQLVTANEVQSLKILVTK